jgi:hypothetical protein
LTGRTGIEKEFKRRIKTQTILPSAETAAMLFWALLASRQITMRKVDGWHTLAEPLAEVVPVDLARLTRANLLRRRSPAQAISTRIATAPS